MAGLFLCAWHFLGDSLDSIWGFLGFDFGSQSLLPLLPSELHLGFHLESLGFDLGVPTRHGSGKVFLSTSDTQIVHT